MEEYLIDRESLERFIDQLFKKKPASANNAEELAKIKEEKIKSLDNKINKAIISSLDDKQLEELEGMLDRGEDSPELYDSFFKDAGVNVESIMTDVMQEFEADYLGGQNE